MTTKRVRMDPDQRRAQILEAAGALFGDRPYSEVSVSDIAAEAGIAKGLLHHYFGSKRDLYLEVVREVAAAPTVPADDAVGGAGDLQGSWEQGVDGFLSLVGERRDLWLASVRVGGAETDDEVASIIDESKEILADQTLTRLGLDAAADPVRKALVRGYGGFVQELTVEWLGRGRLTRDQVRTAMLTTLPLLLDQVRPELED